MSGGGRFRQVARGKKDVGPRLEKTSPGIQPTSPHIRPGSLLLTDVGDGSRPPE